MPLKNIIAVLSSAAILSTSAYALNKKTVDRTCLDSVLMQEVQSQEDQNYLQIKKMFDEADSVGYGIADMLAPGKKPFEYNDFYKNICSVYSLKDVLMYKFNRMVLKPAKKFVNTTTNEPMNLIITYKATKPGQNIPSELIAATQKEGLASPTADENTPVLGEGKEYFVFIHNVAARKGTRRGVLSYLEATDENKAVLERIVNDYKK